MENEIKVTPVSMSGVGSFMVVNIGNERYKSAAVSGEFDKKAMDNAMEEIYSQIPSDKVEAVELRYYSLLKAMENTEAENKYREEHPEEFITDGLLPETSVEEITENNHE